MDFASIFNFGGKYFDKSITPKCDYCQFGKRAKDGEKVLCVKKGLVGCNESCGKFAYSPLKRIPVKQLNFVGSLADDDMYSDSASDIAEKAAENNGTNTDKKPETKKDENKADENTAVPTDVPTEKTTEETAETAE
jgi:hypothetical protein